MAVIAKEPFEHKMCRFSYNDPPKCAVECSCDEDSDCSIGKTCFKIDSCIPSNSSSHLVAPESVTRVMDSTPSPSPSPSPSLNLNYCGVNFSRAEYYCRSCPRGLNSECGTGEKCFAAVSQCNPYENCCKTLQDNEVKSFCGMNFTDAATRCDKSCDLESESDCADGEICFGVQSCTFNNSASPNPEPQQVPSRNSGLSKAEFAAAVIGALSSVIAVLECIRQIVSYRERQKKRGIQEAFTPCDSDNEYDVSA